MTHRAFAGYAFAFIVTAFASVAGAQTPQSTPFPTPPKPNLTPLAYFNGSWTCPVDRSDTKAPRMVRLDVAFDPNGYWQNQKLTAAAGGWAKFAATEIDKYTYDSDTKRWIDVGYDDHGGYNYSISKGWNGNTMAWTDETFVPTKDTLSETPAVITKVSAGKYTYTVSFRTSKGTTRTYKTVCTKT